MTQTFQIPPGLNRYPHRKRELLQAWDSADELMLSHLSEGPSLAGKRILIVNDQFGALSGALEGLDVTSYTDSYLSFRGTSLNSEGRAEPLNDLGALSGVYDLVLIRVPKNQSYFEDILAHLSGHLRAGSQIICGYMVKYQAKASFDLLNQYIGPTTTSLAKKKARLIFAAFERSQCSSPYPLKVSLETFEIPFVNHSNLFSREKLDVGTRFLLDHLPQTDASVILDLGCGNGVVGIAAKRANSSAKIVFSDESWMAIQSARVNYENHFSDGAEFLWTNCYEGKKPGSVDLVLCNPPFHQGAALGDQIAWQMFRDAHQALKPGGLIRVVGNTHLQYSVVLKRIFGNSQVVATHPKFMIVDAVKT